MPDKIPASEDLITLMGKPLFEIFIMKGVKLL